MTADDEEAMMPMKLVIPKPTGIVISWDQYALLGRFAKREKSGSLTMLRLG